MNTTFKQRWPKTRYALTLTIALLEWVDHRESYTNGVRTKWSQRFATEKGILSTNDKQLTAASAMPFNAEGRDEFLVPAPFEGVYALHDAGLQRSLLSQRIQDNPGRTSLEWIDDDAKLTILFEDGPIRPRRVEVWLSHKHNWHPIRVRWFHPSSSKNVPFRHEYAARVTAVDQKTTWEHPSDPLHREFIGLIQIDRRFPEGTPLFNADFRSPLRTHILNVRFQKSQCFSHFYMFECEVISCRPGGECDR